MPTEMIVIVFVLDLKMEVLSTFVAPCTFPKLQL